MQTNHQKAFTMVELIFVIIIIGILAAIALPKFAESGRLAHIARAESTVMALRSAVATERQKRILRGDLANITDTEVPGLLGYPLDSDWSGLTFTGPSGNECAFSVEVSGEENKLVITSCSVAGMTDL